MFTLASAFWLLASPPALDALADDLTVLADAVTLTVPPRVAGRSFLELPALEYRFRLHANCSGESRPASASIAVADSRISLSAADFAGDEAVAVHDVRLGIPALQLPPVAIDTFCAAAPAAANPAIGPGTALSLTSPQEMTISAALSAHASLLCSNGSQQKMTYVTTPLDLRLICAATAVTQPSE